MYLTTSLSSLVGTRNIELDVCKLIPRWLLHCLVIICPGHDHAENNALRPLPSTLPSPIMKFNAYDSRNSLDMNNRSVGLSHQNKETPHGCDGEKTDIGAHGHSGERKNHKKAENEKSFSI